jgi:hypothetical protein
MTKKNKKKSNPIHTVGETADGKKLVDGIWKTYETHGMPLDILFTLCIRKSYVPDWISLYKQMLHSGMEHSRILSKLEEAINDSFGKEFCDVVISRLDQIFKLAEVTATTIPIVDDLSEKVLGYTTIGKNK